MKASRTWRLLAVSPVLAAPLWWFAFDPKVSWKMHNVYRVGLWDRVAHPLAVVVGLFALAATLTFATDAAQNPALPAGRRFILVVWMIVAAPLAVPLYWAVFVRGRDEV
ncbi:MAG TPA: hypothetical protein VGI10_10365 [Polyangiaceae bacterium]|jgi:hypothetical protein